MTSNDLAGRRVLVVEDEMVIACLIEDALIDLGCVVIGPIAKLDDALAASRAEVLDAAILDVTIKGGQIYPVADELISRHIPFLLASGYGNWALPENLRDRSRLTKPFTPSQIQEQVSLLLRNQGEALG